MSDQELSIGAALIALMGEPGGGNPLAGMLSAFDMMEWAQDEIEAAQTRHGETGEGPLHRTFSLLALPAEGGFELEAVYRAHARELLDRVQAHGDLTLATDAEVIIALKHTSLVAPLKPEAVTLYFRLFARRLPDMWARVSGDMIKQQQEVLDPEGAQISLEAYETVHGRAADDLEQYSRTHVQATDRSGYDPHTVPAPEPDPEQPTDE